MKINKVSLLEGCNDLKNIDSNVVVKASTLKKTKSRKTITDKSILVSFTQQTNMNLIPSHFNHILNTFVSLDMVVNKLIKQRIPLYFDKISEVLKEMNIKNFDLKLFGEILRIFPESYFYEFNKPPLKITRHYKEKLKLIPNLDYGNNIDCLPKKLEKYLRLDQLILRKSSLNDRLLGIVREKHIEFLMNTKNNSKLEAETLSKDSKWHEEFDLESNVEFIEPIVLDRNITDAKLVVKERTPGKTVNIARVIPGNKSSPLRERNTVNSIPFCRLSITGSPSDVSKENMKVLSKSPLVLVNNNSSARLQEKISSPSNRNSLEPNKPRKTTTFSKSPLSTNNNLYNVLSKPAVPFQSQSNSPREIKAGKSLKSEIISRKSNDKENKSISIDSSVRKSIITPPEGKCATPARLEPHRKSGGGHRQDDSINNIVTPKQQQQLNQSRLTTFNTTPRGNFIANLAMPDSPMMLKDEFFLKQKLPAHLKILAEMFISLDKLIYENRRKNKSVCLSMICNSKLLISKYKFTEFQLGRIVSIYPAAYLLKWESVLSNNNTMRPITAATTPTRLSKIDITINPNFTKSKEFPRFDFEVMNHRRQRFFENCFEIVVSSYREFLVRNDIAVKNIEEHIQTEDWNKTFNIDLHVKQIEPTPMPVQPETQEKLSFNVIRKRVTESNDTKINRIVSLKENEKLKSLPKSLMDKVLQNKAKSMIFAPQKVGVKLSLLPELVEIIATEFERSKRVPIGQSHVQSIVCKSLFISEGLFNDYLNKIIELVPDWLEKLSWTNPTLSLSKSNMSLDDVKLRLKTIIIAEQA